MVVPLPFADSISSVPPQILARSFMPIKPMPLVRFILFFAVKADAVVLDDQRNGIVALFEQDGDVFRLRVFVNVVERFLRDAVKIRFDFKGAAAFCQVRWREIRL